MKNKNLVENITNQCKDFYESMKLIKKINNRCKLYIEENYIKLIDKLSHDLSKSDLSVKEKMRLRRLLDKVYNESNILYWENNDNTDYKYLENLSGLVTSSSIEEDKRRSILVDLMLSNETRYTDNEHNEFRAIERAQAGLHEVGVDYNKILKK